MPLTQYNLADPQLNLSLYALKTDVPAAMAIIPPAITVAGAVGAAMAFYSPGDHTHPSDTRRERVQTATDGTATWTYSAPFPAGVVPRIDAVAEAVFGSTDVINVQVDGTPTNVSCNLRVTRTNRSLVALIGLTILSVPASPGATWIHAKATAP